MKFWKAALPNLSLAFNIALLIVLYLDRRNPMMGFLIGAPFAGLLICSCIASLATAVVLYASWRKAGKEKKD